MTILKKIPRTATGSKGNRRHYNLVVGFDVGFVFTFYVAMSGCLWISYGGDSRENVNLRKDGKTNFIFLW